MAARSRTESRSSRAVNRPGGRVIVPCSTGRCSERHLPKPPSSTATRRWPNTRKVHHTLAALRFAPELSYTMMASVSCSPSLLILDAKSAAEGSM
jgi:hypothetical protein